jgi:hypothetical protein
MENRNFDLINGGKDDQNDGEQGELFHFPQPEKISPLKSEAPFMFIDVPKDKNFTVARFLFNKDRVVSYNKNECLAYVKSLEEKVANVPDMERRSILEETLKNFKYALKQWPENLAE